MAGSILYLSAGKVLPQPETKLRYDYGGDYQSILGATVVFQWRVRGTTTWVTVGTTTIVDATTGHVICALNSGDVVNAGSSNITMDQRWAVTLSNGMPGVFPTKGVNTVVIQP